MRKRRAAAWSCAAIIALVASAEVAIRVSGLTDVPLYRGDARYGYVPVESQSGVWLDKNRWVFNELSMASYEAFRPGGVLVIGDSIVSGGNQLDHSERVGPRLAERTRTTIWPISAGSWTLLNELAWLRAHPQVVAGVDGFVFVLNDGDFGEPSVWRTDPNHPDHKPISHIWYLIDRQILNPRRRSTDPPASGRDWRAEFRSFTGMTNKPVLVILYPARHDQTDNVRSYAEFFDDVIVLRDDPRWAKATYRDTLHPDAGGTDVLAAIIAGRISGPSEVTESGGPGLP